MKRIEKTVFLSYRRTNASWALAIYQNLKQEGFDVFFDYTSIASGDFESIILENIKARAHFIVLLTPSALERCGEPDDWLRREVETALDNQRNIIPLLLENFDFDTPMIASQLTSKLFALKRYNGLRFSIDYFEASMTKLREKFLNVPLDAVLHPASKVAQRAVKEQQHAAAAAPVVKEMELTAVGWLERGFSATDEDEQLRCYSEVIRLQPDFAHAYLRRGAVRADKGDSSGALEDFNVAIRLRPDDAFGYFGRGLARAVDRDMVGAMADFDDTIRLKPDFAPAYLRRSAGRTIDGDVSGAQEDLNEAIRLNPDLADAYYLRGEARREIGDLDGALEDLDDAIRLKSKHATACYYHRGVVRKDKGDLDGALQDFSEVIRRKSDDYAAYYHRCLVRREIGDLDGALEDAEQATRIQGSNESRKG